MSLMEHYGMLAPSEMNQKTELRIANEMGTTWWGTSQERTVAWLEAHGFNVTYGQRITADMLFANLKKNIPVIIVWNDWGGHSMLAIGYYKDVIFFADPSTSSYVIDNKKSLYGINAVTLNQLNLMWLNAEYFFNPTHTTVGMYIIAVPK
jgi:hypothetical protein